MEVTDLELLNSTALKLIDYRHEYLKSMSQVVRDALVTSLDVMIQQGIINKEIKMQILSESDGDMELRNILEGDARFRKGPRQLYKDFEKIRQELDEMLKKNGLNEYFESESSVAESKITVLRQYSLKKEFILEYFGLSEMDLIQLMKKRGFAEKFAVLRLNLIFDEILEEIKKDEEIVQGHSLVYYNPDITGFSIDFKYHVKIPDLESDDGISRISKKIVDMDRNIDIKFKRKTGIDFYSKKAKRQEQKAAEELKKEIEKLEPVKQTQEQPKSEHINSDNNDIKETYQEKQEQKKQNQKNQQKQSQPHQDKQQQKTEEKKQENKQPVVEKKVDEINFDDLEDFDV